MNKARGLSIIAITLLILQMFSVNFGMGTISNAANNVPDPKVEVKSKSVDDDTLSWEVAVSALGEEEATVKTNITFSSGQSHKAIDHKREITADQTKDGYVIETPADGSTHIIQLMTTVTDESQAKFKVSAETEFEENTYNDEAQVEVEREVEEESKALKTKKGKEKKEENSKEGLTGKDKKNDADKSSNQNGTDINDGVTGEEGHVPLEQYDNIPPQPRMNFPSNMQLMNRSGEPSATHQITEGSSTNVCLRVAEGEIEFFLPAPEVKQPVDIVIVQDASGSYAGNETNARDSLKSIVNMLDFSVGQDRMMVTSYRGHLGWEYDRPWPSTGRRTTSDGPGVSTTNHSQTGNSSNYGLIRDETRLNTAINNISFDGGTPTASGLRFALQQYTSATQGEDLSNRETIFVLVTDGVANVRLDGRVHVSGSVRNEQYQQYQGTFAQVESVASTIKNSEYKVFSAYWENLSSLTNTYGTNYYNQTIGPAARAMVQNVATSPNYYSTSSDINTVMQALLDNLHSTINQFNGFQTTFEISPGFEFVANSVKLNGNNINYTVSGNTVTINANSVPAGDNTLTYKLKETTVHGQQTTPVTNGEIKYDKKDNVFQKSLDIPNANLAGNENSEHCNTDIVKSIAKDGSNEFVDSIELDDMYESFTYKLEYQFGENVASADSVQLKDELEAVLEFIGDESDIDITSNINNLTYDTTLLNDKKGFMIDINKPNGTFDYLAGKKITITFQAKIKDSVTSEDLVNYSELGIPNEATLVIDGEVEPSNEVYVQPPKFGTIKIVKVDADNNEIRLEAAIFEIRDSDENVVYTLTTDTDGTATSGELPAGEYTLEELEAPMGYELLTTDLTVTIDAGMEKTKTIENKRLKGSLTINKVDEDGDSLDGAEFRLTGPSGYEKVEASEDGGKIVFDNLEWGVYTLKETEAPEGYRLLNKEITVEITKDNLNIVKTIKNSNQGWEIPKTGGMGSLGFLGAGFMLMAGAGWFVYRRRYV